MKSVPESREKQYRLIFDMLCDEPTINKKKIAEILGTKIAGKIMTEAFDLQRVVGPELRKDSYLNCKEYMYFVNCDDPESLFLSYQDDTRVVYHTKTSGFCDLWAISREKMDIEGDVIIGGIRSDYFIPKPPDHSWEDTIRIMGKKIEAFDPSSYTPKGYIQTHWDETIEWSGEDELMYQYFKFNLRKPLNPIVKAYDIPYQKTRDFFEKLPQCCTIVTHYFPEGLSSYLTYLFMFETDYEDFIIDVFSELPTTSYYFKVSDRLFVNIHIPIPSLEFVDLRAVTVKYIPLFARNLLEKGIIKRKKYTIAEFFFGKNL